METIELTSDFLVDIDETGAVCGIELLNAGRAADRRRRRQIGVREPVEREKGRAQGRLMPGGRITARETISALRKDMTAKSYGGEITRKPRLLEKQKVNKEKMRQFGGADIPQEAFISALKVDGCAVEINQAHEPGYARVSGLARNCSTSNGAPDAHPKTELLFRPPQIRPEDDSRSA